MYTFGNCKMLHLPVMNVVFYPQNSAQIITTPHNQNKINEIEQDEFDSFRTITSP